ncbi:HEAT repeat domain-containing protein [Dictyobacter formicarum]|uniref:NACHT domain-containing protein n=1 Tax=Dictyobacter formicarum TaxID=2778368 RepID=A0ABQ3VP51_9CHLR|nr:HEAT repeat domain-containing protein [Dictyobacter formicarum]GHO88019.1 hypothetical protein KSZ_60250 [Dictyobacter formicarum]
MEQKRYAYLVGANGPTIQGKTLKYAERDAQLLAEVWRDPQGLCKFTAVKDIVADSYATIAADFLEFIQQCNEDDVVIFHFAGHGIFYKQQLYLVCNDTNIKRFMATSIKVNDIKAYFQECRSRYKVLILDCCHAAGAHSGGVYGTRDVEDVPGAVLEKMKGSADVILSACSQNEKARELEALDGGSGFLSWAIRAACSTRFHELIEASATHALSFHQLYNWLPKVQEEVNTLYKVHPPLPLPRIIEEKSGYGEIWLTDPPLKQSSRPDFAVAARRQYLQYMVQKYSQVTLPIEGVAGPLSLQAIFQPLELKSNPLIIENLGYGQRRRLLGEQKEENIHSFSFSSVESPSQHPDENSGRPIIAKHGEEAIQWSPQSRLVILGGPGTGKTTTLKYLVKQSAEKALSDETEPLPVFLSLADLARTEKTLPQYLKDMLENGAIEREYADMLWQAITGGKAFIALDSLDEVSPDLRPKIIELINDWARIPGNTWIVGSRFTEYKGGQFKAGSFAEWELLPMSRELQNVLAEKIFAVFQNNIDLFSSAISASAFLTTLRSHRHASDWGQNPLLLSLAALIYARTGDLLASRVLLYKEVVNAIVTFRAKDEIHGKQLLHTFSALAYWLYLQRKGRTFTKDDILTFLDKVQRHSWHETYEITRDLIASGLLDVVAHETYSFRHQTFQEYLVAVELSNMMISDDAQEQQEGWDLAWSKRMYSRWTEILCMLGECLYQSRRVRSQAMLEKWLLSLLQQRESKEGDIGDLGLVLAIRTLAELSSIIEQPENMLIKLEHNVVLLWLKELSNVKNNRLRIRLKKLMILSSEIGALYHGWTRDVVEQIREYLQSRNGDVVKYAQIALEAFGRYGSYELLMELVYDPSFVVHSISIKALEEQRERVPLDVWMKLVNASSASVRREAVKALGGQKERVSLDVWIKMVRDRSLGVQSEVVRILSAWEEQIPLEVWMDLIYNPDPGIRHTAAGELRKYGERVPVKIWQDLALAHDTPWIVRSTAVEALRERREQVPLDVWMELMSDTSNNVRLVVVKALEEQGELVPLDLWIKLLHYADRHVSSVTDVYSVKDMYSAIDVYSVIIEALSRQRELISPELLTSLLDGEDWSVRSAIVEVLDKQEKILPLNVWMDLLYDFDEDVRIAAVKAVGKRISTIPADIWKNLLNDKSWEVRYNVVIALEEQGHRVPLEVWRSLIYDDSWDARDVVADVLKGKSDLVPLELWLELINHNDVMVKFLAVLQLLRQGREVPLRILKDSLQYNEEYLDEAAIEILGEIEEQISAEIWIKLLDEEDADMRWKVINVLKEHRDWLPLAEWQVLICDQSIRVRKLALAFFANFYTIGDLDLTGLQSVDLETKKVALHILADENISLFINDKNPLVRKAVVDAWREHNESVSLDVWWGLAHDDIWEVRRAALDALWERGRDVPMEMWKKLLREDDSNVRSVVVEALGERGKRVPMKIWQELLHDESWMVRCASVKALRGQWEQIPMNLCQELLHDESREVRSAVMEILGEQEEYVSIGTLIDMLHKVYDETCYTAKIALENLGVKVPIKVVEEMLVDEEEYVRATAVEILSKHGEQVPLDNWRKLMNDPSEDVRSAVVKVLEERKEQMPLEEWRKLLNDRSASVRTAVVQALEKQGEQISLEEWREILMNDPSEKVRTAVIQALEKQGKRISLEDWMHLMRDFSENVRRAAVFWGGEQEGWISLDMWREILTGDSSQYVRAAVIDVLGKWQDWVPLEDWMHALYDHSETVKMALVRALEEQGDRIPLEIWKEVLQDDSEAIRSSAIETLGRKGDIAPRSTFMEAMQDDSTLVRINTIYILKRVYPDTLEELLPQVRETMQTGICIGEVLCTPMYTQAAKILGELKLAVPTVLDYLSDLLDHTHWQVRLASIKALGEIRRNIPDRAIRRLMEIRLDPAMGRACAVADDALTEILSLENGIEDD